MTLNLTPGAETKQRAAPPAQTLTLRLDKTKPYSTIHGERQPDDPHYIVHYQQDGLPFDVQGKLVPDDNRRTPYTALDADGKPVQHKPLYDDKRAEKARRKLDRLNRASTAPVEETDAEDDPGAAAAERAEAAESVNFESWLRGEARYEHWQLVAAFEARFSRKTQKESDMVIEMVGDEHLVPEDELAPFAAKIMAAFDKGERD